MAIQTIETIRSLRKEINISLASLRIRDFDGQTFGPENEYTAKGLIAGLNALLIDLLTLTKAPAKFVKFSNHAERNTIQTVLTNINNSVVSKNIPNLATYIDQLKPLIWKYGIRYTDTRQQNLDTFIDELQKRAVEFEERIKDLEEISEKSDDQVSSFEDITNKNKLISEDLEKLSIQFHESLESLTEDRESINNYIDIDKERYDEISELLSEAKSNSGLIDNFIKRVEKRELQLEKQEAATEYFSTKIETFTEERVELLKEARSLIDSAKIALEYKTAEGLSAAFMEKYTDSKNDTSLNNWIYGAVGFVAIALGVGVWILAGKDPDYRVVLGRISLLPMLVAGAWFCASQYVKQINLREDYAYKSVLSKSIVGFSEQLKETQEHGEEYTHYIKSVLEEIHKDPLRRRSKEPEMPSDIKEDLKTLISDSKVLQELTKKISKKDTETTT